MGALTSQKLVKTGVVEVYAGTDMNYDVDEGTDINVDFGLDVNVTAIASLLMPLFLPWLFC